MEREHQLLNIILAYKEKLHKKIRNRELEMQEDRNEHYLLYNALGISNEEGYQIDYKQNVGRFLYKYAGSLLEELAIMCFKMANSEVKEKVMLKNTIDQSPKQVEIDCLVGNKAYEIKWKDATTDGDHIKKEEKRVEIIKNAGYIPVRIMFFESNREQARKIQSKLKRLYQNIGGEYYSGEEAWEYLKSETGIDLKKVFMKQGAMSLIDSKIVCGDSADELNKIAEKSIDLIYLDPPFFTQDMQKQKTRDNNKEYTFNDRWADIDSYLSYMELRLRKCKDILKETGSIFLHCDRNAAHYLKVLMDKIFGMENFQSEIIWYYKRWSNSKKGLLNNHQVIFFYSKTKNFKFNKTYTDYSVTTNIDQILQERVRDENGKSKYKIDENGEAVLGESKKGVPLSDVWEIPYLNPKAKERVGYPTQKPIILLERIIKLVTDEGGIVLDPFMGSGTTVVAAKLLNRKYIGIDISSDAVQLTNERLEALVKTESHLLKKGKKAYQNLSEKQMQILKSMNATPVQRNSGIDGFLSEYINGRPVSIKIQKDDETMNEALGKLMKASKSKKCEYMILIRTHVDAETLFDFDQISENMILIDQYDLQIEEEIKKRQKENCGVKKVVGGN